MLNGFTDYISRQNRKRHIIQELNAYSDRELDDIGIVRADITSIARKAARK